MYYKNNCTAALSIINACNQFSGWGITSELATSQPKLLHGAHIIGISQTFCSKKIKRVENFMDVIYTFSNPLDLGIRKILFVKN